MKEAVPMQRKVGWTLHFDDLATSLQLNKLVFDKPSRNTHGFTTQLYWIKLISQDTTVPVKKAYDPHRLETKSFPIHLSEDASGEWVLQCKHNDPVCSAKFRAVYREIQSLQSVIVRSGVHFMLIAAIWSRVWQVFPSLEIHLITTMQTNL